ncbi:MAG: SPOR domain-containing protein [Azoarcus sp.]|jgi:cell division septation protein DedD|nr:SPOR domain-containing protein [Azoarcus sp.]
MSYRYDRPRSRQTALLRAGVAVVVAMVLLLLVLWFEESRTDTPGEPSPASHLAATESATTDEAPPTVTDEGATQDTQDTSVAATAESVGAPQEQQAAKPPLADGYMVQLGVFGAMDNAEKLRNDIASRALPVRIESRVVVGPFQDKAEAETMREQLQREGIAEGIVVPPRHAARNRSGTPGKTTNVTNTAQPDRSAAR